MLHNEGETQRERRRFVSLKELHELFIFNCEHFIWKTLDVAIYLRQTQHNLLTILIFSWSALRRRSFASPRFFYSGLLKEQKNSCLLAKIRFFNNFLIKTKIIIVIAQFNFFLFYY